jgi:AAA domain
VTGIPSEHFDASPLRELGGVVRPLQALRAAVRPFVGTLRRQYRMHSSLSRVPRELFYFGEALDDGAPDRQPGCRVQLVPVRAPRQEGETNEVEARAICDVLAGLNAQQHPGTERPHILVITPYRAQEQLLGERVAALRSSGGLDRIDVEVCTLDRCQGREAAYVFISLVRGQATAFLDAPKRWNVALTRAMQGLFIVGDIAAYQREAEAARHDARARARDGRPLMSLLARIVECYTRQIAARPAASAASAGRSR